MNDLTQLKMFEDNYKKRSKRSEVGIAKPVCDFGKMMVLFQDETRSDLVFREILTGQN
jgi:hypothetical protein